MMGAWAVYTRRMRCAQRALCFIAASVNATVALLRPVTRSAAHGGRRRCLLRSRATICPWQQLLPFTQHVVGAHQARIRKSTLPTQQQQQYQQRQGADGQQEQRSERQQGYTAQVEAQAEHQQEFLPVWHAGCAGVRTKWGAHRGLMVMFSAFSVSVLARSSATTCTGHVAPCHVRRSAAGTSMMISFSVGLASLRTCARRMAAARDKG